ncbi:sensor histidine kinase [Aquimarina sp. Aq107]|uniref:sensor histidine kinase n=1 Tax=Aquimarina sp. Aq107 TaxID=1191912 RepID=UPI000D55C1C2|nr:sensor histidine kinase [Aquimarina sp. Aq107]
MIKILFFISLYGCCFLSTTVYSFSSNKQTQELIINNIVNLEYENANRLIKKIEDWQLKESLKNLNLILYNQGQEIQDSTSVSYQINLNTKDKLLLTLNNLAFGYNELFHKPNEGTSFTYFFEAYRLAKEKNDTNLRILTLLGILEYYHYEFVLTSRQYEKYLLELKSVAKTPILYSWYYLHYIYFKLESTNENEREVSNEIDKLEQQIKLLKKNHRIRPLFLSLKAINLGRQGKIEESKEFHLKTLKESADFPFLKYIRFRTCYKLAELYNANYYTEDGLKYIKMAEEHIDISDKLRSQVFISKYISENYKALAEKYIDSFNALKKNKNLFRIDSMAQKAFLSYRESYTKFTRSVQLEHELDYQKNTSDNIKLNKQLQTAEKEKQILIEQQQKKRNQNIAIGLGGSLILGSTIAILIYRNTKRKQRIAEQEREIEIQKTEKLLKEQELTAIDAMISGQEKERQRLANDLHDNLGSTLATVKLHFDHLKNNRNNPKVENIEELYSKTNNLLDEAYQKVRTIAHEKNSGVMAKQGLLPAVRNLAKKASNGNRLQIEVQDYGLNERLDNALEISIFRIIQELITNTIKHAGASEIGISLTNHDSLLNIIVEDNGKGFNAKVLPEKDGMGLKSIEKRIEHLEGTFEIDSTIGKGTNIIINIPI